jgi:formylglycine-generating enzyme required for sulfatase activity
MIKSLTTAALTMTISIVFACSLGCDKGGNTSGTELDTDSDTGPDGDSDGDSNMDSASDSEKEKDTTYDTELTWVEIPGGTYMMGSEKFSRAQPVHQVTVPTFEINKTEVTVGQYRQCVDAGACEWPTSEDEIDVSYDYWCNYWGNEQENHPVNCISWNAATDFCTWAGGRLPAEAEWEYAARSGGKDVPYPWGEERPNCDWAVMEKYDPDFEGDEGIACETGRTWPVCSKPIGNTEHGLCDMAGNLWELVQDYMHDNYIGAPNDGSAFILPESDFRVKRGGGYASENISDMLHVSNRFSASGGDVTGEEWGFRCVR